MPRPKIKTMKKNMTEDEVQTLLDFVRWKAESRPKDRYQTDRAILEGLLFSGLRNFELCNLDICHLPAYHHAMVLEVIKGKGAKDRDVPIPPELSDLLLNYAITVRGVTAESDPHTPLFIGREYNGVRQRIKTDGVLDRITRIGEQCAEACETEGSPFYGRDGVFRGKNRLWVHKLRYVAATRYYVASGNDLRAAQLYLGHKSVTTTQAYLQTGEENAQEIAAAVYL